MIFLQFDSSISRVALAGIILIGLSLLILVGIVLLRLYQNRAQQWQARRDTFWSSWFDKNLGGTDPITELPDQSAADFKTFLSQWIDRFGQEESRKELRLLADRMNLSDTLKRRYTQFSLHGQLLTLTVLGYIEDRTAWQFYQKGLRLNNPLMELVCIRSMIHAHHRRALDEIFGYLRVNELPTAQVQFLIAGLAPKRIETALLNHLETARSEAKMRLIPYFKSAPTDQSYTWLISELESSDNTEIIAQSLSVLGTIGSLEHVRNIKPFLEHETWFVRVRAVHALGELSYHEDDVYLHKIKDSNWWVRRAAAIHLIQSTDRDPETLRRYLHALDDPYATEQLIDRMEKEDIPCPS